MVCKCYEAARLAGVKRPEQHGRVLFPGACSAPSPSAVLQQDRSVMLIPSVSTELLLMVETARTSMGSAPGSLLESINSNRIWTPVIKLSFPEKTRHSTWTKAVAGGNQPHDLLLLCYIKKANWLLLSGLNYDEEVQGLLTKNVVPWYASYFQLHVLGNRQMLDRMSFTIKFFDLPEDWIRQIATQLPSVLEKVYEPRLTPPIPKEETESHISCLEMQRHFVLGPGLHWGSFISSRNNWLHHLKSLLTFLLKGSEATEPHSVVER